MDNKYLDAKLKMPGGSGVSGQRDLKDAIGDNGAIKCHPKQVCPINWSQLTAEDQERLA